MHGLPVEDPGRRARGTDARLAQRPSLAPAVAGGEYESFFTDDDARLDFARPAAELHRLVWAWRYTIPRGELHGALAELDGETVRVLASSLVEVEGARPVECADAPLWIVRTEPVSEAAATHASAPAEARR